MHSLAIIGSAGRGKDYDKLSLEKYKGAFYLCQKVIKDHNIDTVVSGGAAWMDHLAVSLFKRKVVNHLHLYLPTDFDVKTKQFVCERFGDAGSVANYYHSQFNKKTDILSLEELYDVIGEAKCGVSGVYTNFSKTFFQRNELVAKNSDICLALTFGQGSLLGSRGTKDTMNHYKNYHKDNEISYHVDLHDLTLHCPAQVYSGKESLFSI